MAFPKLGCSSWCQLQVHSPQADLAGPVQVLKVLHGADSDIVWLQRDFGIYVINLFDTGQAARVLTYPSAGLAYLLSRMCGVKVRHSLSMCVIHLKATEEAVPRPSSVFGPEDLQQRPR